MVIGQTITDKKTGVTKPEVTVEVIIPRRFLEMLPDVGIFVQDKLLQNVFFGGTSDNTMQMDDRAAG